MRGALAWLRRLAFGLGALVLGASSGPALAADRVTFNMSWLPQGSMAGLVVADHLGFFREAGIEVSLIRGFGGIRTANELDQGLFDFGYLDPVVIALNRANGGRVRLVASLNASWPAALCVVGERHKVAGPKDLAGLTIGGGQTSTMQALLPVWLRMNGVDPATVKIMQLDPSVVAASLIEGRVDAAECWFGNSLPVIRKRATDAKVGLDWIRYGDFGLDMYGSGIATTDRMIADKPDLVRRFVAAAIKGYRHVASHRDEATDIILSRFPVLDRDITKAQIEETATLLGDPAAIGRIEGARIAQTTRYLKAAGLLKADLAAEDVAATDLAVAK